MRCLQSLFHQDQQFHHAIREHQRFARNTVSQEVLDSSVRLEVTLSFELRQAQLNNESVVQFRERNIFLRGCNDAQDALRQQTACVLHEQNRLIPGGDDQMDFVRHHMGIGATRICEDSRISVTRS